MRLGCCCRRSSLPPQTCGDENACMHASRTQHRFFSRVAAYCTGLFHHRTLMQCAVKVLCCLVLCCYLCTGPVSSLATSRVDESCVQLIGLVLTCCVLLLGIIPCCVTQGPRTAGRGCACMVCGDRQLAADSHACCVLYMARVWQLSQVSEGHVHTLAVHCICVCL